jgi:hypothetical protein
MSTKTQDHEELIALWLWIQSFPAVSSAIIQARIDHCTRPDILLGFIQGCLDKIEIARYVGRLDNALPRV